MDSSELWALGILILFLLILLYEIVTAACTYDNNVSVLCNISINFLDCVCLWSFCL